jgi:DNA-binding NarL/FixJ family response regulator
MQHTGPRSSKRRCWRVIIADDYELVRSGIRAILEGEKDFTVVGEAANGLQAVEMCQRLQPDLILIDVQMPKMNGMAATQAIKTAMPSICVIIITIHESTEYLIEALRAGAAGYLLKETGRQEMLIAIRRVLNGETILNGDVAIRTLKHLASDRSPQSDHLQSPLTQRETEVIQHLAQGKTNREIADVLTIAPGTVKVHVERIIAKLGVSDRTQAAVRAIELGLYKLPRG